MTKYEKEEEGAWSMYSHEEVYLGVFHEEPEFAELKVSTYPDGSPKNQLRPNDLRELARMLEDAADELESDSE